MEGLANKVAIVTGGSSGIGRAICLALSDEGCKVAVLSRQRSPKLEAIDPTDTLLKEGIWVYCDVSKSPYQSSEKGSPSGSLADAIETVVDKWGRLDILINNAGALNAKDFLDQTEEEYDKGIMRWSMLFERDDKVVNRDIVVLQQLAIGNAFLDSYIDDYKESETDDSKPKQRGKR